MSQSSMLATMLPSRKILPLPKRRTRGGNEERYRTPKSKGVASASSTTIQTSTSRSSLSLAEMNRALALANITTNYQRPDKALIVAMRNKQQGINAEATNSILSPNATQSLTPTEENITPASNSSTLTPLTSHQTGALSEQLNKPSDWEAQAKKIIEREGHSLDRDWSRISWKQKASNIVRLKLLKDDGYDITPLTKKGVTADKIIDALLAHIQTRKGSQSDMYVSTCARTVTQPEINDNAVIHESSTCRPDTNAFLPQISNTIYCPNNKTPTPHFTQQQTHPNTPHTLLPQKRKHTPSHPSHPRNTKKRRLHSPHHTTRTIQTSALHALKRQLCRTLFASSRKSRSRFHASTSPATGGPQVPILRLTPRAAPSASRVVFTPQAPGRRPSGADAYITSAAFELLGREMAWLAASADEEPCLVCDSDAQGEEQVEYGFRLLVQSWGGEAVLEGEPRVLVSLLRYLRDGELMHLGRWAVGDVGEDGEGVRDVEMKVVWNERFPFHLSPATSEVLGRVAAVLEEGVDEGGGEVRVGVVRQMARFSVG
ncbi:hypothetical protein PSV09DRAFT_2379032 [Bipolaris maydis]|nr:hypothetical protein PSV09DRAFT_2379032 [Bipolaris maydis]